ncbi:MAG: class I SAM-dependent RNA methyltransferase [Clostridia bacterium]|nr:class I SAM-dependent RNA methyltransferase [Clostridia bacterium]
MKICVSCPSGCEAVLKRELYKLGYGENPAINGRICFEGDIADIAKCNLFLRTANRVYIEIAEFKAKSFDELYDGVSQIDWLRYVSINGKFDVVAKCVDSTIHAISVTQSITKKAIVNALSKGKILLENGERYRIEVAIIKDHVSVLLDTSGSGLHRRGYRALVGEAPLKETLAATIIDLTVWNYTKPFADLFCGSGTFAIEAALKAQQIPAGSMRDFDFLYWPKFDRKVFDDIKAQAMLNIKDNPIRLSAFDIDEKQLTLARKHAKIAGVEQYIHFQKADMRDFSSAKKYGVIITNPPYGERLSERKEIEKLMKDYGKVFARLDDWSAYTLTPVTDFERLFGKKADKKRKIYNGPIECYLYSMMGNPPPKQPKASK